MNDDKDRAALPRRRGVRRPQLPTTQRLRDTAPPATERTAPLAEDAELAAATTASEADGAASVGADADAEAKALRYLDAMLEANQNLNLSGIRDRDAARVLHVADSFAIADAVLTTPRIVIGLGSGNGFPGVAVAALWPQCQVICVERTTKKARAIEACAKASGLFNVEVVAIDAAQIPARIPGLRERADLVLSRAMAELGTVLRLALPLLATPANACPAHRIVQWKAASVDAAERMASDLVARHARLARVADHVYELAATGSDAATRVRRLVIYDRLARSSSQRRSSS